MKTNYVTPSIEIIKIEIEEAILTDSPAPGIDNFGFSDSGDIFSDF